MWPTSGDNFGICVEGRINYFIIILLLSSLKIFVYHFAIKAVLSTIGGHQLDFCLINRGQLCGRVALEALNSDYASLCDLEECAVHER